MKFTKVRKLLIKLLPALGGSVLILFNSVSPALANGSSDTFIDTAKINMTSSSNFVTDGALKISPTIGGDGADSSVTISANKNINADTIAGGRSYADGINYNVDSIGTNTAAVSNQGTNPVAWLKMDESGWNGLSDLSGNNNYGVAYSPNGGYWTLDEWSGNVADQSGNGYTGFPTNTTVVAGKYGYARSFNGISDYISMGDAAGLKQTGEITIEAWVYATAAPSTEGRTALSTYRYTGANTDTGYNFGAVWTGTYFRFEVWNGAGGGGIASDPNYFTNNLNKWVHVAGVYKPSQYVYLYEDGQLVASQTTGVPASIVYTAGDPFMVGQRSVGGQSKFQGNIDDIRVYKYARTQSQIQDDMNNTTVAVTTGKYGYARSFNGISDHIDIANSTLFDVTNYTIEAWVYSTNYSQNGFIFEKGPVNTQYSLFFEGGSVVQRSYNSAGTIFINQYTTLANAGISNSNWYHIVSVYDGSAIKLYVNGVLKSSPAVSGTLRTGQAGERIGAYGGTPAYFFNGTIDDVRIYNYARSPTQIAEDGGASDLSGRIAAGDDVLLINAQGHPSYNDNVGNYEILTVQSVSNSTITFSSNIQKIYGVTTSNSNLIYQKVMIQRVPNYNNVTINNGFTLTASAWDGLKGGIVAFKASGTVKVYGAISVNALGYRGGPVYSYNAGYNGESFDGYNGVGGVPTGGAGSSGGGRGAGGTTVSPAGNRGGGGGAGGTTAACCSNGGSGGGAGGGYGGGGGGGGGGGVSGWPAGVGGTGGNTGTRGGGGGAGGEQTTAGNGGDAGANGGNSNYNGWCDIAIGGTVASSDASTGQGGGGGCALDFGGGGAGGGGMYGVADLSKLFHGSGGGGSSTAGAVGGGIVFIQANTINVSGSISSAGGTATTAGQQFGTGGNGSGGSILLRGSIINIGAYLVGAPNSGGTAQSYGGSGGGGGGVGRIRAEYITSFAGWTSAPSISTAQISAGSYYTSATIQSNNLLTGISETISSIDEVVYNLSATATTATIQYSQDASTWKNAAGTPGGTDTLTTGADNTISLSTLVWSGANFFYKIAFTGNGTNTPVLNDITVKYTLGSSGTTCSPPLGGNFAITSNCSFANYTDGVDNGNLTIKNGATLTVSADQILARNSGKSITIETGGSIWINTTGQIAETNLWVQDSDGDGLYNPSVNNGTAAGTTVVAGKYGNARSFNGTSDYIAVPASSSLNLTGSLTLETWFQYNGKGSDWTRLVAKEVSPCADPWILWGLMMDNGVEGSQRFYFQAATQTPGQGGSTISTTTAQVGTWYHLAGVYDKTAQKVNIYINGLLEGTPGSFNLDIPINTSNMNIGRSALCGGGYAKGVFDDVRIYNYARSVSQIAEDMNKTAPSGTGPLAWWKMNEASGQSVANYAFQMPASTTPATGYIRRYASMANSGGTGSDGSQTFNSNTNLNTWNHSGRTCADGGDAVNYSAISLGPNSASLSSSVSSGCLVPYDKVLLINLAGTPYSYTNVGNYEILTVQNISGSTVYFTSNKTKYYGDSANTDDNIGTATTNQRVMLQRVPQYGDVTTSGTVAVTPTAWNGVKGGVLAFTAAGTVTVAASDSFNANGLGYRGGVAVAEASGGQNGESFDGYYGTGGYAGGYAGYAGGGRGAGGTTVSPAGNRGGGGGRGGKSSGTGGTGGGGGGGYGGGGAGGGGGSKEQGFGGGGGGTGGTTEVRGGGGGGGGGNSPSSGGAGGNAGAAGTSAEGAGGAAGTSNPSTGEGGGGSGGAGYGSGGGGGGGFYGIANLSKIFLGSGGGGTTSGISNGGAGGGIVLIYASTILVSGSISASGAVGADAYYATGGGAGNGSGGSILLKGSTITLGANLVTAPNTTGGGASYQTGGKGGGGVGRIAVGAVNTPTGSTNPSYTTVSAP